MLSSQRLLGALGIVLAMTIVPALQAARATVTRTNYQGWSEAYVITNGVAEVVVVPAVGRVMQFGFAGEEGVFWENPELLGKTPTGAEPEWQNFGGDKAWPSPESDWPKYTKNEKWKPPVGFDGLPMSAKVDGGDVFLTSQIDPSFGIRVRRRIHLHPKNPVLYVQTVFERMAGDPITVGVWVVTQFKDPLGLYAPAPASSLFTNGYALISQDPPPGIKKDKGLLSFTRNPSVAHKIGTDVDSLLWVGEKVTCRVDSPRVLKKEYPDHGSNAEIYTSPDPLKYIELETLGPLRSMKRGDSIYRVNTYTLSRRKEKDAEREARNILLR